MNLDLFTHAALRDQRFRPLAERMRPKALTEFVGQEHLATLKANLSPGGEAFSSLLLCGPPGSGKTTLALLLAETWQAEFISLSAVMSNVKELREVIAAARERHLYARKHTVVFIDEIHRFNKAQQDALLPHVESGLVTLIGATTENPAFAINSALLSRFNVLVLKALTSSALLTLLTRALTEPERGLGNLNLTYTPEALQAIATFSDGDARRALNVLELSAKLATAEAKTLVDLPFMEQLLTQTLQQKLLLYDREGEEHYSLISALIKSLRGSDPHAAVYWLVRMLEGGEPPRFIMRRLVIFASEDIGNADPQALGVAVQALTATELVGLPEAVLTLTQAVTYLATAPKSNAVLKAYHWAKADVQKFGSLPVPYKLRNASTSFLTDLGYGAGYRYPHEEVGNYVPGEDYLPPELIGATYYEPSANGLEAEIRQRLEDLKQRTSPKPEEKKS